MLIMLIYTVSIQRDEAVNKNYLAATAAIYRLNILHLQSTYVSLYILFEIEEVGSLQNIK